MIDYSAVPSEVRINRITNRYLPIYSNRRTWYLDNGAIMYASLEQALKVLNADEFIDNLKDVRR